MTRRTSSGPVGWARIDARTWGGREGALWQHVSGWHIEHCGHPTALYPYYLWHDGLKNITSVVSHNGLGFTHIKAARAMVEEIAAGTLAISTGGCVAGVARIPTRTASGGDVPAINAYWGTLQGVWTKRGMRKPCTPKPNKFTKTA